LTKKITLLYNRVIAIDLGVIMRKILKPTLVATAVSIALTGCGGGGGPGGAGNPYIQPSTNSFIRVGSVKPLSGSGAVATETAFVSQDIDGTGGDELILVGRQNPTGATAATWQNLDISIWGWQGGQLVNKTTQWFGSLDRRVTGVEEEVKFGDFDGDGHRDMYAGPYTDEISLRGGYELSSTGAVFFNSGNSSFNQRTDIVLEATTHAHASTIADINNDGRDDIWSTAGGSSTVLLGNANRTFTRLSVAGNPQAGGAGIAIADFTAVGTKGVILTDQGSARATTGSVNNLYSYTIDLANSRVDVTHVSALPAPRFELPRWAGQGFSGGHEVRVLADIELSTGRRASSQGVVSDAVIISRANQYGNGQWPELSEVQFLKNGGTGNFADITDTVLKGYDTSAVASYNASFKDINGDGRLDIVLPGNSWTSNSGAQVLIWRSASNIYGFEYQASYATVLKAFQDGAKALESNSSFTGTGVALIQDASGAMYIATAVGTDPGNTGHATHRVIYITPLNGLTYNQTEATIRSNWPWLTNAQVSTIMSQSTRTYLGLNLLDPAMALSPQGVLAVPTAAGLRSISGSISGVRISSAAQALQVKDAVGRAWTMDYSSTHLDRLNAWSQQLDQQDDASKTMALTQDLRYGQSGGFRYGASADSRSLVFGMPEYQLGKNYYGTWQLTNLPYSPWMNVTGSWGSIKNTTTTEATVTWRQDGWRVRSGAMYTTTQIDPGLVTRVNPITAVWGDVGYSREGWSLSAGTLPRIIAGSAELTLPTSVNNRGQVQYTSIKARFDNPLAGFTRLGYQGQISKRIMINAAGMVSTQDSYSVKMEIKSSW
jgi:hypothetical protein